MRALESESFTVHRGEVEGWRDETVWLPLGKDGVLFPASAYSSQLSVTLLPGDSMPSSGFCRG